MGMITGDWLKAVGDEFKKPYYKNLYQFVKDEYSTQVIYPPSEDIFNALHFTPLKDVKVLNSQEFIVEIRKELEKIYN